MVTGPRGLLLGFRGSCCNILNAYTNCPCMLQVVLLGDAAHTMTPILGQGLNCGLEDVIVFADVLEQHAGDVNSALPAYNHARWPDVEAMLNINEIVARRDYTLVTKASVLLCMHVVVQP